MSGVAVVSFDYRQNNKLENPSSYFHRSLQRKIISRDDDCVTYKDVIWKRKTGIPRTTKNWISDWRTEHMADFFNKMSLWCSFVKKAHGTCFVSSCSCACFFFRWERANQPTFCVLISLPSLAKDFYSTLIFFCKIYVSCLHAHFGIMLFKLDCTEV